MAGVGEQRHAARQRALEVLYEAEMKQRPIMAVVNELALPLDPYATALLVAVSSGRAGAEELIGRYAIDWPLERIAVLDRLIMTLALCEIDLHEAPLSVILDEAVELTKLYSGEEARPFVNGILASIARDREQQED